MPESPSPVTLTWRRTVSPVRWALRAYWGTAVLLAATAATALTGLLPVTGLGGPNHFGLSPRLGLAPWRGGDLGMSWSSLAWSPGVTQHAALVTLFHLLLAVAAAVLGVATLTIVSVSAARASDRTREFALRRAVGARREDLLTAAVVEAGAIAAAGAILGGSCGLLAGRVAAAAWPAVLGPATSTGDVVTLGATATAIILGAVLPLVFPQRRSPLPAPSGKPLELVIPALQLGLGLTILTAATLVNEQARRSLKPSQGPQASGEVFELATPEQSPATRSREYRALLRRLAIGTSARTASLSSPGTLLGLGMVDVVTTDCGRCFLGGLAYPVQPVPATHYVVSADTFRVLGLSVASGRGITDRDGWGTPPVAVVNRWLAAHHFQDGKPLGRGILIAGTWYRVVGVVEDQPPLGFGAGFQPPDAVYVSVLQQPARSVDLLVPVPSDPRLAGVERWLRTTLGEGAQVGHERVSELVADEGARYRWFGRMFAFEGWMTLVVAAVGTFAVMRLWINSLFYELGVRRAVGAQRRDLFRFVLWRVAGVAVGGVVITLWVGLFLWGALATAVAGLPEWDVGTALRLAPILLAATIAGALPPLWRAARVPPGRLLDTAGF